MRTFLNTWAMISPQRGGMHQVLPSRIPEPGDRAEGRSARGSGGDPSLGEDAGGDPPSGTCGCGLRDSDYPNRPGANVMVMPACSPAEVISRSTASTSFILGWRMIVY